MLSSVFRRLYFTDASSIKDPDFENKIFDKIQANDLVEENKEDRKFKSVSPSSRVSNSKSFSELNMNADNLNRITENDLSNKENLIKRLKLMLLNRRKYQAN